MFSLKELVAVLEKYAPLSLSEEAISNGDYDNSGIIVHSHDKVEKVLFSLDLSLDAVKKAKELLVDTIITHHPAIYYPIKKLSVNDQTAPLIEAIKNGVNIVSMHLNLDMAKFGIDFCLAEGLGAKYARIISPCSLDGCGYGREFMADCDIEEFVVNVKKIFKTDKILNYGNGKVKAVASFCGGGSDHALGAVEKGITDADTLVTSDIPHHILKELIEKGKKVVIIPHYVSEQYGFNKFYACIKEQTLGKILAYYFEDKRFM